MDVYAEVLRWQKQMQDKSTEEAQIVLNSNLEQIAKVKLLSLLSIFLVLLKVFVNSMLVGVVLP